jgi:UPF0755 protein
MMLRRNLVVSCVVLVLVLPVLGWAVAQLPRQPLEAGVLDVPVGTHAGELAAQLREGHGMRMPVWLFRLYTRLDGSAARLQAGEYQVGDGETVAGLLARMVAGDVVSRKVVLVEGWTFRQVLAALHRSPRLEHRLRGMDPRCARCSASGARTSRACSCRIPTPMSPACQTSTSSSGRMRA